MKIKLKDVALKTGYSVTTVSRALTGYDDVSKQTRQRILATAHELGYQPNQLARHLQSQRSHTIGLIFPSNDHSFSNDFFTQLMLSIGSAASASGYDLLVSSQPPDSAEEMAAYQRMVGGNRVDGMIVARTRRNDTRIAYLEKQQHPFVVSGRGAPDEVSDYAFIDADSQQGIFLATQHFIELGHRHIGLILPPADMAYTEYRLLGYEKALASAGIKYQSKYVVHGNMLQSGGYQASQILISESPEITTIVACNDLMALGAISAIQELGLQVGEEIAVSGFDDIPAAEYAHPELTTVRQPIYAIGQQLMQMLIALIEGKPVLQRQLILETTLVVRESSGRSRS